MLLDYLLLLLSALPEGKTLNRRELRRLQSSLYNHLQSEFPELPNVAGDRPEDLTKLGYFVHGDVDNSKDDGIDWDLAYDKGKQTKK